MDTNNNHELQVRFCHPEEVCVFRINYNVITTLPRTSQPSRDIL